MRYSRKENEEWQNNPKRKNFVTYYAYKEGVFLAPNGKWVARVKKKGSHKVLTTLSQHTEQEDAQKAYDNYHKP